MITILLVNNSGSGFADYKSIEEGTTINNLFNNHVGGNPDNFLVRVNREQVSSDYVLKEGDRVTFSPTKIEGA